MRAVVKREAGCVVLRGSNLQLNVQSNNKTRDARRLNSNFPFSRKRADSRGEERRPVKFKFHAYYTF